MRDFETIHQALGGLDFSREHEEAKEALLRLAKDARRYRWLRERDLDAIHAGGVFAGQTPQNLVLNGEDLDGAVDAAIGSKRFA